MQKRQFEAILTPNLHGTVSCRHTEKGVARAKVVYQCLQKGGKGGGHVTRVLGMGEDIKKHCPTTKF